MRIQWFDEITSKTNFPKSRISFWNETKKFPKIPKDGPYIVITTVGILRYSDRTLDNGKQEINPVYQRDLWKMIVVDEIHGFKNLKAFKGLSLLRLRRGLVASKDLKKRLQGRNSKKKEDYSDDGEEIIDFSNMDKQSRIGFWDSLVQKENEGSPNADYIGLSGTFLVNSIRDIMSQAIYIGKDHYCKEHKELHRFSCADWWQDNILWIIGTQDIYQQQEEAYQKARELFREFVSNYFCSFTQDQISLFMNLPKLHIHHEMLDFDGPIDRTVDVIDLEENLQKKHYDFLARNYCRLHEQIEESSTEEKKGSNIELLKRHLIVCIMFLCMICLHPACIRAELTKEKNKISKHGKLLLRAYKLDEIEEIHYKSPSVKTNHIAFLIDKIKSQDPKAKIVVFSFFRSFLEILYYQLTHSGAFNGNFLLLLFYSSNIVKKNELQDIMVESVNKQEHWNCNDF
jgi:hypothetical protein